jgi:hypothetical protein
VNLVGTPRTLQQAYPVDPIRPQLSVLVPSPDGNVRGLLFWYRVPLKILAELISRSELADYRYR